MSELSAVELGQWSGGKWEGNPPGHLRGVSNDTRTLGPGALYVAIRGANFDGHDFVGAAFARGAGAAVVSSLWRDRQEAAGGPLLVVPDPAQALCDMAAGYRLQVNPTVVAITGSAGKSTVKEMLAAILAKDRETAGTRGNWNNDIGLPLSLLAMPDSVRAGVFEIGTNHPGEIQKLCTILRPNHGIVTNIGPVHVEHFGSIENVAREKGVLLQNLPAGGTTVLNRDDRFYPELRKLASGQVISVSLHDDADYVCRDRRAESREAWVEDVRGGDKIRIQLPVPGEFNVVNAMQAAAMGRSLGVSWERIASALENFHPLPMRWQETRQKGIRIINDAYNANPLGMRASLRAFREQAAGGRKWLVLGDMLELGRAGKQEHVSLGEFVRETMCSAAGPTGEAGTADKWGGLVAVGSFSASILEGMQCGGKEPAGVLFRADSNAAAADFLAGRLESGDAVFLKASRGMKFEEIIERLNNTGGVKS